MIKNVSLWLLPFALLLTMLSGCVTSAVTTDSKSIVAPDAKLAGIKSFAWVQPSPNSPAAYDKDFSVELDRNIRRALEENLKQKGLQKVDQNPDILIAYDLSVAVPKEKDRAENYKPGFGYGYAHMAGYRYEYTNPNLLGYRPIDLYKQGTLVIDLVNPAKNQLIWRGWAEGALEAPDARYAKIQQQIKEVLQQLTF